MKNGKKKTDNNKTTPDGAGAEEEKVGDLIDIKDIPQKGQLRTFRGFLSK